MAEFDYEWRLRILLAERGIWSSSDLGPLLAERGVGLSNTQLWRLVTGKPERLNLHTLMALCDLLDCTPNDLIQPREAPSRAQPAKQRAAGGERGVGDLVPKKARIRPAGGRGGRR
ncbi:MAG: helix-turn-helix transcriptional regulator [Solirubrobacteraceae bacterium MAG38_C4-C5]|nr:helix-turn-helix transcriptional regulator [Candidatus Siliceabacter maunaloa]